MLSLLGEVISLKSKWWDSWRESRIPKVLSDNYFQLNLEAFAGTELYTVLRRSRSKHRQELGLEQEEEGKGPKREPGQQMWSERAWRLPSVIYC